MTEWNSLYNNRRHFLSNHIICIFYHLLQNSLFSVLTFVNVKDLKGLNKHIFKLNYISFGRVCEMTNFVFSGQSCLTSLRPVQNSSCLKNKCIFLKNVDYFSSFNFWKHLKGDIQNVTETKYVVPNILHSRMFLQALQTIFELTNVFHLRSEFWW